MFSEIFSSQFTFFSHFFQVGQLALASRSLSNIVEDWITTKTCYTRATEVFTTFFQPGFQLVEEIDVPRPALTSNQYLELLVAKYPPLDDFGLLCKRITCLSHTRKRLSFSIDAFLRVLSWHSNLLQRQMSNGIIKPLPLDWIQVMNFIHFMKLIQTLTRGWASSELIPVIKIIAADFNLNKALNKVS